MATNKTVKAPKAITVKVQQDGKMLGTAIASIKRRGSALQADIHSAAVSAAWHASKHGNNSLANDLLDAVPSAMRRGDLRQWFMEFTCLTLDTASKQLVVDREKRKAVSPDQLVQDIQDKPFYKAFKDSTEAKQFVAMDEVRKLISRMTKLAEQGKLDAESTSVLAKLQTVAPSVV